MLINLSYAPSETYHPPGIASGASQLSLFVLIGRTQTTMRLGKAPAMVADDDAEETRLKIGISLGLFFVSLFGG